VYLLPVLVGSGGEGLKVSDESKESWMPLSQIMVRAGRHDLIALVVRDDMSEGHMEELLEMADGISDSTGASLAIFPEGVLSDVKNYSLLDLIELRDQIDNTIRFMAERQSIGDA